MTDETDDLKKQLFAEKAAKTFWLKRCQLFESQIGQESVNQCLESGDVWNRAVIEAAQLAQRLAPKPDGGNPFNYGKREMADEIAQTITATLYSNYK